MTKVPKSPKVEIHQGDFETNPALMPQNQMGQNQMG